MGGIQECPTEGQGPSGPLPVGTRTHEAPAIAHEVDDLSL